MVNTIMTLFVMGFLQMSHAETYQ